jgi:DNA transposition AAA+ family ATPase
MPTPSQPAEKEKPAEKHVVFPCNAILREKLIEQRDASGSFWSNSTLGNKLGYSSAVLSQYLSEHGCKYKGDIPTLEKKIEDFLKALSERRASGVETNPSKIADEINNAFDYIRKQNQLGVVIAESGEGKSRATELVMKSNPLTIFINVTEWNCSKHGIMSAIWQACPHDGWDRSGPQFPWLVTKMRGSDRPFLFDNAHKLGRDSLSLVATFQDETKCPVILLGLNILVEKLVSDLTSQSTSRVGVHWPVKIPPKSDKRLLAHMIKSICKDINGELDSLLDLAQQVADHHGHFRAVEQRLKGAAELRRADAAETWTEAFRLAHQRSLHPCKLT